MSEINETMLDVRTKIDEWGLDFNEGDAVATLICYSLMKKTDSKNRFLTFALNQQLDRAIESIRRDSPTIVIEPHKTFKRQEYFLKPANDALEPKTLALKPNGGRGKKRSARTGKKNKCSKCQREGHKAPKCTFIRAARQSKKNSGRKCSKCQREGHTAPKCTFKRAARKSKK